MYRKLTNIPNWLNAKLQIVKLAGGKDCQLGGDTANAILFGGTFGPMVEPLVTEIITPNRDINEIFLQTLKEKSPTIVWKPFLKNDIGGLENVTIGLEDNIPVIYFLSEKIYNDLKKGIVNSTKNNTFTNKLLNNYPALKINNQDKTTEILTSHSAILAESQEKSILKKKHNDSKRIMFPSNTIGLIQDILRWHSQNIAHMEWVCAPQIGEATVGNPWIADDLSFRNWLLQQSDLVYAGSLHQTNEIICRGLLSQTTDQKGTHQGWKTWQHALNTTMRLSTDHLPFYLKKPLRIAMLMHDVGKTNHKTLWAAGCHAAHGSKVWKRSGISVSDDESNLISFIIKNHDILGTLDKTIKNPNYTAGISVEEAVERIQENPINNNWLALNVIEAINDADIGSLSTLKYLTSITTLLADTIRINLPF